MFYTCRAILVPSFLGHYQNQNWAGTILWKQRKSEPERKHFFEGEERSVSERAGLGLFLGFSPSLSASNTGGAVGQELANSLPIGRLPLIRARIALACQLPTPQLVWEASGLWCLFLTRKEIPKFYFSLSIRNSGVVWLGNLPGNWEQG